jgi:hypothetical protein
VAVVAGGDDVAVQDLDDVAVGGGAFPGAEKVRRGRDPGDARGLEGVVEARARRLGQPVFVDERVVVNHDPWWVRGGGGGEGAAEIGGDGGGKA